MKKTLVLGLGNPILSDDGVGLWIARRLGERLPEIEVREEAIAGISILDVVQGFSRLVIIDSIMTEDGFPGQLHRLTLEDLGPAVAAISHHGTGLASTFEVGRLMGYELPESVEIYAVEIENNTEFGECFSAEVEKRLPGIVETILRDSFGNQGFHSGS
jgi:hydrogenase maturation protease